MLRALHPFTDAALWARTAGVEILVVVAVAVVLARLVAFAGRRFTRRLDTQAAGSTPAAPTVPSERDKHRHALAQVITWVLQVVVYVVATLLVLQRLSVPIAGLVPVATVVGLALGFGAQRVVGDLLAGFFIVTERQYGYGDVIRLALASGGTNVTGTVEDVTPRVTQIRTINGEVVITPNGQIVQVTNLSRDWARAVVDVPVPLGADLARVCSTLEDVGSSAYGDTRLGALLLDPPSVMGVESLEVDTLAVRLVARTLPGQQFEVGRQLRARAATALRHQGLNLPPTVATADATAST